MGHGLRGRGRSGHHILPKEGELAGAVPRGHQFTRLRGVGPQFQELGDHGAELKFVEKAQHFGPVRLAHLGFRPIEGEIQVGDNGDQGAVAIDQILGVDHILPGLGTADLVHVGVDPVQVPILFEKLDGGLVPHAGDAGDVVRRVAGQGLHVDKLLGGQIVAILKLRRTIGLGLGIGAAGGVEDLHMLVHQLEHIPIPGQDQHVHVVGRGPAGQGTQHIIRLVVGVGDDGDGEGAQQLLQPVDLAAHLVGHAVPGGLVVGEGFVTPGIAQIKGHGHMVRLIFLEHGEELARKAIDRCSLLAAAGHQGGFDPKEGPVGLGMSVN